VARSINIPGLLRLVIVRSAAEAAEVDEAAGVDRPLSGRGRLINRLIAAKLAPFTTPDGQPWPAFAARLDALRAERQSGLEEALSRSANLLQRLEPEISDLAAFVCDRLPGASVGVIVQQAIGRLFFPDYRATDDSYAAAVTLSTWLSAGPIKSLLLKRSGRFQAALDLVTQDARGNASCAHAIGIALHGIIESVILMQQLASGSDQLHHLSPEEAVAQTLRAPARIIREARDRVQGRHLQLQSRSLILIPVESLRQQSADRGAAFAAGRWNQCPAHAFVPSFLAQVWRVARDSQ